MRGAVSQKRPASWPLVGTHFAASMANRLKNGLAIIGLSVLAVLGADLLGRAAAFVDNAFFDPPHGSQATRGADPRADLAAYEQADYDVDQLLREIRDSERVKYQPYTIWARRAFDGELTNVDVDGIRATHNNSSRDDALQIWMFGGSTTWGVGAPDDQTVPSHLAGSLNQDWGVDSQVRNLGERGFVSTQEVIYLIRELQAGRRPHVAIFYDGVNDAASAALWPETPGTHVTLDTIRDRFEDAGDEKETLRSLLRSSGLYRAARIVLDRIGGGSDEGNGLSVYVTPTKGRAEPHAPDFGWLGEQAISTWLENRKIVAGLAREYGFTPIFMFHPGLWSEGKPLDPSEADILSSEMRYASLNLIMNVRAAMAKALDRRLQETDGHENVYNLNDVFEDVAEPLYIDYAHVTGRGNEIVAERILEILKNELCRQMPMHISDRTRKQLASVCE